MNRGHYLPEIIGLREDTFLKSQSIFMVRHHGMGQIFLSVISLKSVNGTTAKIEQVCSRGYDLSGIVLESS